MYTVMHRIPSEQEFVVDIPKKYKAVITNNVDLTDEKAKIVVISFCR